MLQEFKTQFIFVAVLWALALVLVVVDIAGPGLGAPPKVQPEVASAQATGNTATTPLATLTPTPDPALAGPPPPYVAVGSSGTGAQSSDAANNQGQGESQSVAKNPFYEAGPLYQYTRLIPAQVSQSYGLWHWFYYLLPALVSFLLWRTIRRQRQAQQHRMDELAQNSVWVEVCPPTGSQRVDWQKSALLMARLNNYMAALPHNRPENRRQGYGIHLTYELISPLGDKVRMFIRVPLPAPDRKQNGTQGKGKGQRQSKRHTELSAIPDNLLSEVLNTTKTLYPWAELKVDKTDPLDMETYAATNAIYRQYKENLEEEATQAGHSQGVRLVRGYQQLALGYPSQLPLYTDFEGDPTNELLTRLDLSKTYGLLAAAVILVSVPITPDQLRKQVERAIHQLHAAELGHAQRGQQALTPYSKGDRGRAGAANPLNALVGGGGKAKGTGQAARSKLAAQQAKSSQALIAAKAQANAATTTYVYLLVEGVESAAEQKLKLLASTFTNLFSSASGQGQVGRDLNTFTALTKPRFTPLAQTGANGGVEGSTNARPGQAQTSDH